MGRLPAGIALLVAASMVAGCGSVEIDVASRAATIRTEGCGLAADETGSAVAIGGQNVATAAHLVGRAADVYVTVDGAEYVASIVRWDRNRDLAVLSVDGLDLPSLVFADARVADEVTMVGGRTSGTESGAITLFADLTIEAVMSDERVSRLGYQSDLVSADGDSGAGVFDTDDRLVGIVFGIETESRLTWITAASELEAVLEAPEVEFECDPARSQITPLAG